MKLSHICSGSPASSRLEHSETEICRGNEQCEKSRQSAMGSLLTDSRIDLTFHSATARMSEGKARANVALRVEFSTFIKLFVELRANSGTSRTRLHTATGAAFPAPGRSPINRQSPQRASSRLERGALWRSLAQPCARKPRNVSV